MIIRHGVDEMIDSGQQCVRVGCFHSSAPLFLNLTTEAQKTLALEITIVHGRRHYLVRFSLSFSVFSVPPW